MMKRLNIGLLGIGTVGSGVFAVLQRNAGEIARRTGCDMRLLMVADIDEARARRLVADRAQVLGDARQVIAHPDIDVVVELIGGYGVAKTLVLEAIAAGKHVVTANKALLAVHGEEIFAAAAKNRVMVLFEAAVAGGIPILKTLREGLTANQIEWVAGIINGTTNFILSQMRERGISFDEALQEAQRLGYAEADPTFDIEGIDVAHKVSLMSAMAFGIPVQFDKAYVEGITRLHPLDIQYAQSLGYRIKLLGIARRVPSGVELRVHPTLIPMKRLIASVEGAMNAVIVHGDAVGTTLYYGQGAGSEPTASAVIADLVDIARLDAVAPWQRPPVLAFQHTAVKPIAVVPIAQVLTAFYLRLRVRDEAGVLAQVTSILAEAGISVDGMLQREATEHEDQTDLVILTHECVEATMDNAIAKAQRLPSVLGQIVKIRKEELT